jgi:hypothetical protein
MPINNALTPEGQNALGAAFGYYPQLRRQGQRIRELALARDVNTLPDPRTYAAVSGLLGEAPDQMGFSVMHPDYQGIRSVADPAYALGIAAGVAPALAQPVTMVTLEAARAARQAALAGGRTFGPTAARMSEGYLQRQGLIMPLDVYHGTPHTLPPTARNPLGEFDASKIGTGEGAQAYGFGIYTAEAPATAMEYQRKLSSTGSAKNLANQFGGVDEGLAEAKRRVESYKQLIADGGGGAMSRAKSMLQISEKNVADLQAVKAGLPENTGSLYKVDLPDAMIPKMLDYDKQMSEQSLAVQKILLPYQKEIGGSFGTGEQTLKAIAFERRMKGLDDSPAAVAEQLRQMGIPGIKYLDEASRAKGEGTRNFVTFPGEEKNLRILERNGQPVNALAKNQ